MGYLSELTLFDHVKAVSAWQGVGLIETGQDSVGGWSPSPPQASWGLRFAEALASVQIVSRLSAARDDHLGKCKSLSNPA